MAGVDIVAAAATAVVAAAPVVAIDVAIDAAIAVDVAATADAIAAAAIAVTAPLGAQIEKRKILVSVTIFDRVCSAFVRCNKPELIILRALLHNLALSFLIP